MAISAVPDETHIGFAAKGAVGAAIGAAIGAGLAPRAYAEIASAVLAPVGSANIHMLLKGTYTNPLDTIKDTLFSSGGIFLIASTYVLLHFNLTYASLGIPADSVLGSAIAGGAAGALSHLAFVESYTHGERKTGESDLY